jgi:hypothetical protein
MAAGASGLGRLAHCEVPNNTTEMRTRYTVRLIWNHFAGWRWRWGAVRLAAAAHHEREPQLARARVKRDAPRRRREAPTLLFETAHAEQQK